MNNRQADERLVVGLVVAPHGVRGDLRVLPDTDRPEIFKTLPRLFIGGKPYRRVSGRPHKNVYIIRVEGVVNRNEAEALVGQQAEALRSELPPREKGFHYYFEITGLMVEEEDGRAVGTVKEILQTGANDVYVVVTELGEEICLPDIPSCILSVEPEAGRVVVRLPEWA